MSQHRRPVRRPGRQPKGDYEVGYGKPPVHTRFQKGRSGSPGGPGKRSRSIGAAAEKALTSKVRVVDSQGRRRSVPAEDMIMRRFRDAALSGDVKAATFLLNRADRYRVAQPEAVQEPELTPQDIEILESLLERQATAPKRGKAAAKSESTARESTTGRTS